MTPWLVIAACEAHAERLAACVESLQHDPDQTAIVTSAHHDRLLPGSLPSIRNWYVIDHHREFSLGRLWNEGLRRAYDEGAKEVAVFSSDVVGNPNSVEMLATLMRASALVMAGPSFHGGTRILPSQRSQYDRIPGGCFMLAAEHRLLCDEDYRWWFTDDDLEMQARAIGSVGVFESTGLRFSVNDSGLDTPEKQAWAEHGLDRFVRRWGVDPW